MIKVLLIDTDLNILNINSLLLKRYAYKPYTIGSTFNLLPHVNVILPDVIVVDLACNLKYIKNFCNQLKSEDSFAHIPIIITSTYAGNDDKLEEFGAVAHLQKPYEFAQLHQLLQLLVVGQPRANVLQMNPPVQSAYFLGR